MDREPGDISALDRREHPSDILLRIGRASKRLRILVQVELWDWPEVVKLREQGHEVARMPKMDGELERPYDLILGPAAHRMSEHERPYLPLAIREARRRKYGSPEEG